MADQIIGRVFVKVSPDTSEFREEAKAKLEREEQRLPELTTKLHVEVDPGEAQETAAEARAVRETAQRAMGELTLKVNLDDLGSVQAALAKVNAELTSLGAIELPVDVDRDSLEAMRDLLEERVRDIGIDIKVNLDDDASIERAIKQIEAQLGALKEINLNVDLNEASLEAAKAELEAKLDENKHVRLVAELSSPGMALAEAALRVLTRTREVVIRPVMDRTALAAVSFVDVLSGFRALRENIDQARTAFLALFANLPQIGAMAIGAVALSGALASAAGNAIGLVGALGQLLPLVLAIPGIAIGFAAMAAAFKDFGDQLPVIAERFGQLQSIISDGFWEIARGPINHLLTAALPLLEAGLGRVSTSIGAFFASFAGSLGAEGGFLSELPAMFDRLNESITIFTGHTPALATIMTIFGQIGSSILPPLADLIGKTADEFARFLQGAVAGDGLANIVDSAIQALSGLIETLKGAFQIFGALWQAANAAGMATLGSLGAALQGFAATLASPEIQATLVSLFKSASTMMDNFLSAAGPALTQVFTGLTTVLSQVLPLVGSTIGQVAATIGEIFASPAFQGGLTSFLQGVSAGISALLPALAPIGELVGSLGPVLGQLATQIGQVFGALAPTLGGVIQALSPVITMLGGALMQVLQAVSPAISQIADMLAKTLTALMPMLQPVIDALVQIIQAVLPALMPIIMALSPILLSIAELVLPVVATLLQALAPILAELVTAFQPLIDLVVELLDLLVPILVPALHVIAEALGETLGNIVRGVAQAIGGLVDVIRGLIDFIVGVFTGDWSRAWDGIKSIFSGVVDIIVGLLKVIFGPLGTAWSHLKDGLSSAKEIWSTIWNAIKSTASAIWNAIVSHIKGQIDLMVSVIRGIQGTISGAVSALWTFVRTAFQNGINAARTAVQTGVNLVLTIFRNLPGTIRTALGNLGSLLLNAGKQIIQGLIDGIKAMIGSLKNTLGGITDLIPDWKGPVTRDAILLYDAGQLVIDGFIKGLESRYDAVRQSLSELTKDVQDTEFGAPTANLGVNTGLYTGRGAEPADGKTINYYAAPGSSIGAEEDLFSALGRARAWGW